MSFCFNIERFFNWQTDNLEEDAFREIKKLLLRSKNLILNSTKNIGFENGNLPFLPVLSRRKFNIDLLIKKIKGGRFEGINSIHDTEIREKSAYSIKSVYYIFDVETGRKTLGLHPAIAAEKINKTEKQCMNADEIISLGTHCNILKYRNIWAPESYCVKNDEKEIIALALFLRQPQLISAYPTNYFSWGTPSYKNSLTIL